MSEALDRANRVVLFAMQASVGLLGSEIEGLAVELEGDSATLHVALSRSSEAVEENLSDLVGNLEANFGGTPESDIRVILKRYVGPTDESWPGRKHRLIYLKNRPS